MSYSWDFLRLLRLGRMHKCENDNSEYGDQDFFIHRFLLITVVRCLLPSYLITLSALTSTFGGIVRPICLAAFRLMITSKLHRLLDRKIRGLCAFEDLIHVSRGATVQRKNVRGIRHQTTGKHIILLCRHCRKPVLYG